jgi:hypothetical protein
MPDSGSFCFSLSFRPEYRLNELECKIRFRQPGFVLKVLDAENVSLTILV